MADEEKEVHPLDSLLAEEEAETTKLVENALKTAASELNEDPPETIDEPVTASEETPPEPVREPDTPEPVKEPEPEPEVAPAEAKQEKPKGKPSAIFKQLRELKRQVEERDRKLAELQAKPPVEAPIDPLAEPDDQFTQLAKKQEELERRVAQQDQVIEQTKAKTEEQQLFETVARQEDRFITEKPDYRDAVKHLIDTRREEYEEIGRLDTAGEWWITNHPEVVERYATEKGLAAESDDEIRAVAKNLAFDVIVQQERNGIISDAMARGKNVPEVVYNLAVRRGFKAPAPAAEKRTVPPAQERVQRAKENIAASASISAMQNNHAPGELRITSRDQLLALDEHELDRYTEEMDKKDPRWLEKLA